ncbi:MAG: glutamine synthetase [Bacteroidales bacterium]|nr:glutamine synthetase [Bacteroidales bacterium]MBN2819180.1 glutamine synthetase [Bacteroidales bacterium]
MTKQEIIQKIKDSQHSKVKFAVADIDGILRGKIISKEKFFEVIEKGVGFCDVIFGWDTNDACYNNVSYTGWHSGYPDVDVFFDLSTFRTIPWDNELPFFLADLSGTDKKDTVCPRSLLKKIINQSESLGFRPIFSLEYEWFNFLETAHSLEEKNFINLKPITPGMFGYSVNRPSMYSGFFNDLFNYLEAFQVELEGLHTETGPGVYEAAIRYDDALRAADKAILFKQAVKEIAHRHGIIASFMAKWNKQLPGCGGHIHQSLRDIAKDINLFFNENSTYKMSDVFQSYVAGQLYCLPQILPMYAPTINSYKRLTEGAWAPTTLTWGIDNRTTALRVINKNINSSRLETRVPGADINPYLAIAAALASGLYGIQNNLKLTSAPTVGNAYNIKENGVLPGSLEEATKKMKESGLANELFGEAFTKHFVETREWECRQYASNVSVWELKRYFEII